MEDHEEDLLGGDDSYGINNGAGDVTEFESSFPAIDTRNEVPLLYYSTFSGAKRAY